MNVISVQSLTKEFSISTTKKGFLGGMRSIFARERKIKIALDRVSFDIKEGELVGYIGQNGAGKSTTVKILSGILVPTQGEVKVLGKTPWENRIEVVRQIGVVFGQRTQLYWDLPVIESFELLKKIYRISDLVYKNSLDSLTHTLDLQKLFQVPVRQLSLGQRMRCDIAASLLHDPKILFLDEPTIGLDAISKLAVRDFIRALNKNRKMTVLLTTHDMDDIEALCQRILVLNEGKIYFDGSLSDLRKKISPDRCLILDLLNKDERIEEIPGAQLIKQEGHRVWFSFNPTLIPATSFISQITAKHAISDLYIENQPIEEIIAKFYRNL